MVMFFRLNGNVLMSISVENMFKSYQSRISTATRFQCGPTSRSSTSGAARTARNRGEQGVARRLVVVEIAGSLWYLEEF